MDKTALDIHLRLQMILEKISQAASRAGRKPEEINLVVVTKAQPIEVVEAAIQAGARILGENYAEEAVEKIDKLRQYPVEWHMIGHVQSRKAKMVAGRFQLMHSLDSVSLAQKLNRILEETGNRMQVLLEFNVGEEESKFGWMAGNKDQWPALIPEVECILSLPQLDVTGLMTMPPLFENPDKTRPYFARLSELMEFFRTQFPQQSWHHLSMGTSMDYEAAILEGATFVRVGQAVVGPRPPKI